MLIEFLVGKRNCHLYREIRLVASKAFQAGNGIALFKEVQKQILQGNESMYG